MKTSNLGVYSKIGFALLIKNKMETRVSRLQPPQPKTSPVICIYLQSVQVKMKLISDKQHRLPGKCHRQGSAEGNPISLA